MNDKIFLPFIFISESECKTRKNWNRYNNYDPDKKCIFPFKFKGTEYSKCIDHGWTDPKNNGIAFWCATKVDENNEYLYGAGSFGECDATCKELGYYNWIFFRGIAIGMIKFF